MNKVLRENAQKEKREGRRVRTGETKDSMAEKKVTEKHGCDYTVAAKRGRKGRKGATFRPNTKEEEKRRRTTRIENRGRERGRGGLQWLRGYSTDKKNNYCLSRIRM